MNVVIVGGCLPYPPNSGNRIRTLNLTMRLARRHEVTYVATRNPDRAEARDAVAYLADHGVRPVEVEHTVPPKSGPMFLARLAANLFSPLPYSVASHHAPALTRAVEGLAARGRVDLWQAEWAAGVEAFRSVPAARTLVMAHNVETLIWERYATTEPNVLKRLYVRGQAAKFARFERRAFHMAGRVVTVSAADAALARDRFGIDAAKIDVVDNGIDRAHFEAVRPHRDPRRILFLGSLEWRPNLDAVGLLLERIFPEVLAAVPDAVLEIVGRNPPAALLQRAARTAGVTIHANVADVRPFLARAGMMAVPLRIGGGSRLKILEALATGLPVVSSRVGAEGLELTGGVDLDIVDESENLAPALIDAIQRPERVAAIAESGRAHVLARYDWDVLADRLERSWERCVAGASVGGAVVAHAG